MFRGLGFRSLGFGFRLESLGFMKWTLSGITFQGLLRTALAEWGEGYT